MTTENPQRSVLLAPGATSSTRDGGSPVPLDGSLLVHPRAEEGLSLFRHPVFLAARTDEARVLEAAVRPDWFRRSGSWPKAELS